MPAQFVTVPCPTCGTRLDERVADRAYEVRCPDCHEPVRVPSRSDVEASSTPAPEAPRPDVYAFRTESNDAATSAPRRQPREVLVICPLCSARLHPPQRTKPYKVRCPDCHRPVNVPTTSTPPEVKPTVPMATYDESVESTLLPPPEVLPRRVATCFTNQASQIKRYKPDPPPAWTWFSGVWTFPWHPEVVRKWLFMSLGGTLLGGFILATTVLVLAPSPAAPAGVLLAFFALPAFWIVIWTISYSASACLTIVTETAAGNRKIQEWPDQGWREGMFLFIQLAYLFAVGALLAHVVAWLSESSGGPYWAVWLGSAILLAPFMLLSMLESGHWYWPFSGPVAASLWRNAADWTIGYLLLGLVLIGGGWLWLFTLGRWLIPGLLFCGVYSSALLLISARLLGRLAWRITQTAPEESDADSPGAESTR